MMIMTAAQRKKLLSNGLKGRDDPNYSGVPVIKLFNPVGAGTWLISELDPDNNDRAFALADLGSDTPELGWVSMNELTALRLPFGLKIERDRHWTGDKTIGEYAEVARREGRIVD